MKLSGFVGLRRFWIAAAALGALALPAFAEGAWEKLDHGVDVVRECSGDVARNCDGVLPGEGRIKACMAKHLADLSQGCLKALAEPEPAVLSDGDHAVTKRIENSHLMRYIEMYLAGIDPGRLIAERLAGTLFRFQGLPGRAMLVFG